MRAYTLVLAFLLGALATGGAHAASCPTDPTKCPAPLYSKMGVGAATGGVLSVPGSINAQAYYLNGVPFTGGGGGITQLTGDVLAGPGTGSVATTLATVNSNVGSFTNANITVNAKGLITAAANGTAGSCSTLTFGTHLTGGSFNCASPITLGTDAVSTNTASTLVVRDGSGNFSAGTITASLTGHASLDLPLTGGTLTGALTTVASNTGTAGFSLPQGVAPTSPVNGNMWATSSGVFAQIAGVTVGPFGTGGGASGGNPTATAGPNAINGSASSFMRSDAAPPVQKGSNAQFGIVEGDGSTINCVAGVCTSIGGSATSIVPGTTTIGGATAPCVISNDTSTDMNCIAETGTGSVVLATSPTLTSPTFVTPVLGTPASGVATNLTGTAAGLTAGIATVANGLKSATTTVSVSAATAPTSGQALIATSGTTATWQTVSASASSITPGTTTIVGATAPCVISNSATTVMNCIAETGTGNVVLATSPTLVTPALGTPSTLFLTNATGLPIAGITGLGSNVGTALAIAVGSAGAFVTNGGALGTPSSGVGTNLTGTAASLTAGLATAANGLKTATTTVSISGATAPSSGQVLTATGGSAATWQTPGGGAVSITVDATTPNIVVTPSPLTGTGVIKTVSPLISSATSPYIYNGTGTSGTGAQIDNTNLIELSAASAAMTLPQAGTTGFAAGVGSMVVFTGTGTATITPNTSTIAGLTALTLVPHQFASFGSDGTNYEVALGMPPSGTQNLVLATPNGSTGQPTLRALVTADLPSAKSITPGTTTVVGATAPCVISNSTSTTMNCIAETGTGSVVLATSPTLTTPNLGTPSTLVLTNATGLPNASVAAAPLPTPGTSATLVAPRSYYVCTGTCTVTLPTPAAGYEFCVRNDNNVATVITFAAITSVQFENTNFTSYKTANTSIVSGGAAGDKLCVLGRDATHYLVMSFNGTWS